MKAHKKERGTNWTDAFFGTATVGERGQIVIPSEARAEMDMQPGEKILIMRHPVHAGLMLFKIEAVREFVEEYQQNLEKLVSDEVQP